MSSSTALVGLGDRPSFTTAGPSPLRRLRGIRRLLQFAAISAEALRRVRKQGGVDPATAALEGRRIAGRILDRLDIDVRVSGSPPSGLYLMVSNHRSYMDIPVLMSVAPAVFLAKREIGGWPLVGSLARELHTIFVERDDRASRKLALAAIRRLLESDTSVALFPEGTTTYGPGVLQFRPGSFWLAAELGVPVVPAAVSYVDPANAWIDDDPFVGHFLRQLSAPEIAIDVSFGPALRGTDGFALRDAAEAWVRESLAPRDRLAWSRFDANASQGGTRGAFRAMGESVHGLASALLRGDRRVRHAGGV